MGAYDYPDVEITSVIAPLKEDCGDWRVTVIFVEDPEEKAIGV